MPPSPMTQAKARLAVFGHRQKYFDPPPRFGGSCSPSAIEMVLKIHGKVPGDFYELQDLYKTRNIGFEPFEGQVLHGIRFTKHNSDDRLMLQLRTDISRENHEGRCVVVSAIEPGGAGAHIWLATDSSGAEILALSKGHGNNGGQTLEIALFRERLDPIPWGHYLTYELLEPEAEPDENLPRA